MSIRTETRIVECITCDNVQCGKQISPSSERSVPNHHRLTLFVGDADTVRADFCSFDCAEQSTRDVAGLYMRLSPGGPLASATPSESTL